MLRKKVRIYQTPHCELMPEDLSLLIGVCRDEFEEKIRRIMLWRIQDYKFEKLEIEEECTYCKR